MKIRRLESSFLRAPAVVRTVAANLASWRLNSRRRARTPAYLAGRELIRRYHGEPWELLLEEQTRRLGQVLERACNKVELYAERTTDMVPSDPLARLRGMQPIAKAELRLAGRRGLDVDLNRRKYYVGRTSGSTGTPFAFRLTLEALQTRFGLRDGFYALHGFDFRELNLRLGGRLFVPADQSAPPFWIRDYVTNQLLFSVYHLGDRATPEFVRSLEKHRPRFITGYPSAVHLLAKGCLALGSSYRPKRVFTDSETVLDYQREGVAEAWGCQVVDYYGMETGWLAGQCRLGAYHLSPLTSVVEILDESGAPVAPRAMGEIVVTDLTNPLMPFIRYRTGDLGEWESEPCSCGWNTPTIRRIEGRVDDIVTLPDGRKIGRLDHILKNATGIREAQLVQEALDRFVLHVVPEAGYSEEVERTILEEARMRLGTDVTIVIRPVPVIKKSAHGKHRSVVSRVGREA